MTIKITLGIGLDAKIMAPHPIGKGLLVGGPATVLAWIESQLGLNIPKISHHQRALQYLVCLQEFDSESCFYHETLRIDQFAVAKQLIQWRDSWYLAGWDGTQIKSDSERITLLSGKIEAKAQVVVAPNEGQRLQRVIKVLTDRATLVQEPLPAQITLLDPLQDWPEIWQRLFALLEYSSQIEPVIPEEPKSLEGSDIHRVQQYYRDPLSTQARVTLRGDGSVVIIRAPSRTLSSEWLANYISNQLARNAGQALGCLLDGDASTVDTSFKRNALPTPDCSNTSAIRPLLQLTNLAFDLFWEPINPQRALDFLNHPVGPLPKYIKGLLAASLVQHNGVGGLEWRQCLDDINQRLINQIADKEPAKKSRDNVIAEIKFWLEPTVFFPLSGMTIDFATMVVDKLTKWGTGYRRALHATDKSGSDLRLVNQFLDGLGELSKEFVYLQVQGKETISAIELRRVIESINSSGAKRPDIEAQILPGQAKILFASDPAACLSPVDQLIWWGADVTPSKSTYRWTGKETLEFEAANVKLQSQTVLLDWQAQTWFRPISVAKKLLLVVHEDAEGEHQILNLLRANFDNIAEYSLIDLIQGADINRFDALLYRKTQDRVVLPTPQRSWQLPAGIEIPKSEVESFSSLEKFLLGPYIWVLAYAAGIRKSQKLAMNSINQVMGSLSHKLFETYFNEMDKSHIKDIDTKTIDQWVRATLNNRLFPLYGAPLLSLGMTVERERFIETNIRALSQLVGHLQAAGVVAVELEQRHEGRFVGGSLMGFVDLIATCSDGREAIVDMKWGGLPYHRKSLVDSRCLQLALYAHLRIQKTDKLPQVGYYIIGSQHLLMLDSDFFPDAENVMPASGESLLELWQRIESTWKQRRIQLDKGLIEVNVPGTVPQAELSLDTTALDVNDVFDSFSDFVALVGWEENA